MKKMFLLMAVTALCQFGFSQQTPPENSAKIETGTGYKRHHKGMHERKKMLNDLNLSETQKEKIKAMHMANKEKKDAIINNSSLSDTQKKEQLKELHKTQANNFKSLLTDEQKDKMKAMKKERRHEHRLKDSKLKKPEKAEKVIDNTNQ